MRRAGSHSSAGPLHPRAAVACGPNGFAVYRRHTPGGLNVDLARTATRAPTSVIGRFKLLKLPKQVNEPLGDGLLKLYSALSHRPMAA